MAMLIFDYAHPKIIEVTFSFLEFDTVNFRVPWPD